MQVKKQFFTNKNSIKTSELSPELVVVLLVCLFLPWKICCCLHILERMIRELKEKCTHHVSIRKILQQKAGRIAPPRNQIT